MNDYHEVIQQFQAALLEHNIKPPPNLKADGDLHRFHIEGHKKGTLNGAYKLHSDGIRPAGYFEDYTQGLKVNWKFDGPVKEFTPEEKRAYAAQQRQRKEQQQREELAKHLNTAIRAASIWNQAKPAEIHAYLTKKRIQAHGAKDYKGALVIPLYNASMRLMNLQFIDPDGNKRFLSGGRKKACFWWIGKPTDKILIAEGFATAASLYQATGYQCFIAFDAGNLAPVAAIIRQKKPAATIVICADNDQSGRGQEAAEQAALACDGLIAMPPEPGDDYNDWFIKLNKDGA